MTTPNNETNTTEAKAAEAKAPEAKAPEAKAPETAISMAGHLLQEFGFGELEGYLDRIEYATDEEVLAQAGIPAEVSKSMDPTILAGIVKTTRETLGMPAKPRWANQDLDPVVQLAIKLSTVAGELVKLSNQQLDPLHRLVRLDGTYGVHTKDEIRRQTEKMSSAGKNNAGKGSAGKGLDGALVAKLFDAAVEGYVIKGKHSGTLRYVVVKMTYQDESYHYAIERDGFASRASGSEGNWTVQDEKSSLNALVHQDRAGGSYENAYRVTKVKTSGGWKKLNDYR